MCGKKNNVFKRRYIFNTLNEHWRFIPHFQFFVPAIQKKRKPTTPENIYFVFTFDTTGYGSMFRYNPDYNYKFETHFKLLLTPGCTKMSDRSR